MAITSGEVDSVDKGLSALGKLIEGDAALARVLKSPLYKSEEKSAVLATLGEKLGLPGQLPGPETRPDGFHHAAKTE